MALNFEYTADGLVLCSQHFSASELACPCGKCKSGMDENFMLLLEGLRTQLEFALIVTSGYRCPEHNMAVAETGIDGPHTHRRAVDLAIQNGRDAYTLLQRALRIGFTGIGLKQHGEDRNKRIVHLDNLTSPPRPNVWTYK